MHTVVGHTVWVLGSKLGALEELYVLLTTEHLSPILGFYRALDQKHMLAL